MNSVNFNIKYRWVSCVIMRVLTTVPLLQCRNINNNNNNRNVRINSELCSVLPAFHGTSTITQLVHLGGLLEDRLHK